MYIRDLVAGLLRRWLLVVIGLLVTAACVVAAFLVVPVTYKAEASLVLLPPSTVTVVSGNPFLSLGDLNQAMTILTRKVTTDSTRKALEERFPDSDYEAYPDTSTSGPIIVVAVEGSSADESMSLLSTIVDLLPVTLKQMQQELAVTDEARITITTVTVDDEATQESKTRMQLTIVVGAGGLVLTLLIAGIVDGVIQSRRARSAALSDEAEGGEPESSDNPDDPVVLVGADDDDPSAGRT